MSFLLNGWVKKVILLNLQQALGSIYPPDYKFGIREFRAWKQMMRLVGCTNITPFPKNTSQVCLLNFFLYFINYKLSFLTLSSNIFLVRILDASDQSSSR